VQGSSATFYVHEIILVRELLSVIISAKEDM